MSEKKDLTRIEDLSEFLHQEDPDVDKLFDDEEEQAPSLGASIEELPSLDDLEDDLESTIDFQEPPADFGMPETEDTEEQSFGQEQSWGEDSGVDSGVDSGEHSFDHELNTAFETEESFELESEDQLDAQAEIEDETELEAEFETEGEAEFDTEFQTETEIEIETETEDEAVNEQVAQFDDFDSTDYSAPEPVVQPPIVNKPRVAPENFKDIQEFAKNMSYGKMVASGNPPYSIILKNIRYQEDADDILIILREHGLVDEQNEAAFQQSLNNGALLVSQLSEYSAIYLAHRMRRFELEILIGLSEELHPSKSYESGHKGLLRKENLRQNKVESVDLTMTPKTAQQVLVSTTPTLDGHYIQRYLGVLTEHTLVKMDELEQMLQFKSEDSSTHELTQEIEKIQRELQENDEQSSEIRAFGIKEIYQQLIEQLKAQAIKTRANALVGINFHLTPLVEKTEGHLHNTYKITCTASAVWVTKSGD